MKMNTEKYAFMDRSVIDMSRCTVWRLIFFYAIVFWIAFFVAAVFMLE